MGGNDTFDLGHSLWEERWQADVRSARALAALTAKDAEIGNLKEDLAKLRDKLFNQSICRENRLEDRLESANEKIQNLETQLQASRSAKESAINEKLDMQTNCRATQERLAHAEARISELISQNTLLGQKIKDAKTIRLRQGPRLCQKNELEAAQTSVILAQQRVEEANNKLSGVKAQRETLSNQLRDERQNLESEKQKRFALSRQNDIHQNKAVQSSQVISDLKGQLEEQHTLVQQLQQLHGDTQNLLRVQEEQHKEQLHNYKKSQQKLVLFCQKIENKRKEEKQNDQLLKSQIKKLNNTLNEKSSAIGKLEADKNRQEEETIVLRFEIQQMLDEAQMCDTKNTVVSKEQEAVATQKEQQINQFIKTNQEQMIVASEKRAALQVELESQIGKNSELVNAYETMQHKYQDIRHRLNQRNELIKKSKDKINKLEIQQNHSLKQTDKLNCKVHEMGNEILVMTKARDRANNIVKTIRSDKKSMEVEVETLKSQIESLKLSFVKAKYNKMGVHDSDFISDINIDKCANKAAALELKLLRESVSKLGQETAILRARRDELEELKDHLKDDANANKEENEMFRERLDTTRDHLQKAKHTINIQQQRISAMSDKINTLSETSIELKHLQTLPQRLKSAESRLKTSNTENIQLKTRIDEIQKCNNKDEQQDLHIREHSDKMSKDNQQKRFLIEELRNKVRMKEKDLTIKEDMIEKLNEEIHSKNSAMQQRKRSNDNLRRQVNELKLEKDAINLELSTIRSRLEQSESHEAELRLELHNLESSTNDKINAFELGRDEFQAKQKQAMTILSDRLADTDQSRRELSQTLKDVALALSRRIQKQRLLQQQKCAQTQLQPAEVLTGDCTDKVRIWDTVNKEHILKYEYQPFAGEIRDLAWDGESKRILVGGEGRNTFAAAFLWDSGSKCGNFTGLGKTVNSVDLKSKRPFRAICGTDDSSAVFYKGPPYKFEKTLQEHNRFVNCVRFSPAGDHFATVSADGKVFLYDGKEGDKIHELGSPAHKGGIYACSWSGDSTKLLTASGDKTCKIFDIETGSVVNEFIMGKEIRDQQLGCLWQNEHTISVSLSGHINYLDPNTNTVRTTVSGHAKNISCMTVQKSNKSILTADYDGNVAYWDAYGGESTMFTGKGHASNIAAIATDNIDGVTTVGNDNNLRISSISEANLDAHAIALDDQPVGVALAGKSNPVVITPTKAISIHGNKLSVESLGFEPSCIAAFGDLIVIGNKTGKDCFVYTATGGSIGNRKELGMDDPITAVAFSHDGKQLAVADKAFTIHVFDAADFSLVTKLYGHRARISSMGWSENGWLASGNIDQKIVVHNFNDRKVEIPMAHRMASISGIDWLTETRLVSSACDGTLKQWEITFD